MRLSLTTVCLEYYWIMFPQYEGSRFEMRDSISQR